MGMVDAEELKGGYRRSIARQAKRNTRGAIGPRPCKVYVARKYYRICRSCFSSYVLSDRDSGLSDISDHYGSPDYARVEEKSDNAKRRDEGAHIGYVWWLKNDDCLDSFEFRERRLLQSVLKSKMCLRNVRPFARLANAVAIGGSIGGRNYKAGK
ncbi:hypothetical protein CPB86DRAFT_800017 [Serendipita vermifera]|nr:hypothetical protein CPB86DRAFT_800017 [Serendipita vermifera]